jgi:DNA-binding CsgD family transcriptional regulator
MVKELDKETLERLYLKEKRSTHDIAQMSGCSATKVRYRCIKYGITLRPNTWNRKINIEKSVLMKLYVKENKSITEIAKILSCSRATVIKRCKEHDIPLRSQGLEGLTKPLLQKLYVKEGKTTREIADIVGCSGNLIRLKCKAFGIPLRNPGTKKVQIDESTLRRLYLKEGKCMYEIAKILNCSPSVVSGRIKKHGIKKKKRAITKKEEPFLSWVTVNAEHTFEIFAKP